MAKTIEQPQTITRFSIVNLDVFTYLDHLVKHQPSLENFMKAGGVIGLGVVPTFPYDVPLDKDNLKLFLDNAVDKLRGGMTRKEFVEQVILTASCGTAKHSMERQTEIYDCLKMLSSYLRSS